MGVYQMLKDNAFEIRLQSKPTETPREIPVTPTKIPETA